MARRPKPVMLVGKWLIVPILVGLVGYYFIGPRIGKGHTPSTTQSTSDVTNEQPASVPMKHTSSESDEPKTETAAPHATRSTSRAKARHKHSEVVDQEAPQADVKSTHPDTSDQEPDQGGSAGATSAG